MLRRVDKRLFLFLLRRIHVSLRVRRRRVRRVMVRN
jgi:hypothetical protein